MVRPGGLYYSAILMAMAKKIIFPFVLALIVLNGCAATNKQPELQVAPINTPIFLTYKPYKSVLKYVGRIGVGTVKDEKGNKKITAEEIIQIKEERGKLIYTTTMYEDDDPTPLLEITAEMSPIGELSLSSLFTRVLPKRDPISEEQNKKYSRVINNPVKTGTVIFRYEWIESSSLLRAVKGHTMEIVRGRSIYKNTSVIVTDAVTFTKTLDSYGNMLTQTLGDGYSIYDEHTMKLLYSENTESDTAWVGLSDRNEKKVIKGSSTLIKEAQ